MAKNAACLKEAENVESSKGRHMRQPKREANSHFSGGLLNTVRTACFSKVYRTKWLELFLVLTMGTEKRVSEKEKPEM